MRIKGVTDSTDQREGFLRKTLTRMNSIWVRETYPFASIRRTVSLHYSCEISRCQAVRMQIGDRVSVEKHCCLFAFPEGGKELGLILEDDCRIGPRCTLSARNLIHLGRGVKIDGDALLMDHAHAYEEISRPMELRGITAGGQIRIDEGCQIGKGAVILCGENRQLTLGKYSVVAPRAVVTRSFPAYSMISGNPATAVPGTTGSNTGQPSTTGTEFRRGVTCS